MSNKIITNYSSYSDADLDTTASAGIKGTTGNPNFTFTHNELTNATTALAAFHNALAAVGVGNAASVTAKNVAKATLVAALSVLTSQINIQASGDLGKLQTTGFPLAKTPQHRVMEDVINFQVARGKAAGTIDLSVDKPMHGDNGTVFAFWDIALGETPANIDEGWFHRFSNGHSITITGLTPGKTYPFAAAYKGSDSDTLVWSAIISKMVAD
jgi:hypothetical protein